MEVAALVGNEHDLQADVSLSEGSSSVQTYHLMQCDDMQRSEIVCSSTACGTNSIADDSGIYVTCSEEHCSKDEEIDVEEILEASTTSLSPVLFLFPDGTPVAVVACDSSPEAIRTPPPATPRGPKHPPKYQLLDSESPNLDQECNVYATPYMGTVDEGFQFYQREIVEYKLAREQVYFPQNFLSKQPEVTPGMRACLLEWLAKLTHRCRLTRDTFFLAANILDRFLSVTALSSDCLQLLGIVAIFIAGKQEENCPMEISQLLQISEESFKGEKYSKKQALILERLVLGSLKFDLHPPTSLFFMETLAIHRATGCRSEPVMLECIETRRRLARFALQVAVQDYLLCRFRPSLVAASVLTAVEEALTDDYILFRPGPMSLMDRDFCNCLHEVRRLVEGLMLQNNNSMEDIMKCYATK